MVLAFGETGKICGGFSGKGHEKGAEKDMKKWMAMLLALAMLWTMTACGGARYDEALMGLYTCYAVEALGVQMPDEDVLTDTATMELRQGGKGRMHLEGEDGAFTYTLTGAVLSVEVDGEKGSGTLKDGILTLEILGMTMYFVQEGMEPPEIGAAPAEDSAVKEPEAEPSEPAEQSQTPETEPSAAPVASLDPVSGDLGECHVDILGAESFEDAEGQPGIRFYYDFTNNSDEVLSTWDVLDVEARQEGYELVTTFTLEDVPEYGNDARSILPGVTLRCIEEYSYKPEGGPVELTLSAYMTGERLTMQFDPAALQGRPGDWSIAPIAEPDYVKDMAPEGVYDGDYYIKIAGYEIVPGWNGDAIRVYFDFTNNTEQTATFFLSTFVVALQDGVELDYGFADEEVPEDANASVDVAPGETITAAEVYAVRSGSPVEVFLDELFAADTIGLLCPVQ